MRFLRRFMKDNTVLFVSHDVAAVNSLCNRAVLLEQGTIKALGNPKDITEQYLANMYESVQGKSEVPHESSSAVPETVSFLLKAGAHDYRDMRQDIINTSTLRNDIEVFRFDEEGAVFGKGGATIEQVLLENEKGAPLNWIVGGERVTLQTANRKQNFLYSSTFLFIFPYFTTVLTTTYKSKIDKTTVPT